VTDQRSGEDRRRQPRGGRRAGDSAWSTTDLANCIGMSASFVRDEIEAGEISAVRFGREWRVPHAEVIRYLTAKGWPLPPAA